MYNFQHKSKPFSFTRLLSPYLDVTGINYSSCDLSFFFFSSQVLLHCCHHSYHFNKGVIVPFQMIFPTRADMPSNTWPGKYLLNIQGTDSLYIYKYEQMGINKILNT